MKLKIIVVLITLFIGNFGFSQINQVDSFDRKHGNWVVKYDNSKFIRYKGTFEHGVPVGVFVFYYKSGKVKVKNKYLAGGKNSFALSYHENGKKMSFGKFVNKKRDSTWRYYNELGRLISQENYRNGKLQGKNLVFYAFNKQAHDDRPRVMELSWYEDGEREGDWHKFYNNGKMMAEGEYKAGVLEGKVTYYFATGQKKSVTHYKHGLKRGWSFVYDRSGKQLSKQFYMNGNVMEGKQLEEYLIRLKKRRKAKKSN